MTRVKISALKKAEKELITAFNLYDQAFKGFEKYVNVQLDDDMLRKAQIHLHSIQEHFRTMYPALNFILQNHAFAIQVNNQFAQLMDDVKKSGGQEVELDNEVH